jgi:hypothetical protein
MVDFRPTTMHHDLLARVPTTKVEKWREGRSGGKAKNWRALTRCMQISASAGFGESLGISNTKCGPSPV